MCILEGPAFSFEYSLLLNVLLHTSKLLNFSRIFYFPTYMCQSISWQNLDARTFTEDPRFWTPPYKNKGPIATRPAFLTNWIGKVVPDVSVETWFQNDSRNGARSEFWYSLSFIKEKTNSVFTIAGPAVNSPDSLISFNTRWKLLILNFAIHCFQEDSWVSWSRLQWSQSNGASNFSGTTNDHLSILWLCWLVIFASWIISFIERLWMSCTAKFKWHLDTVSNVLDSRT